MNTKKLIIAVVVVFVLLVATNYLIHSVILASTYEGLTTVFRSKTEMDNLMWRMFIANLIWSFFFVFIFTKGYQNKGLMEGVRYGVYIALFMSFAAAVAQNVVYPIPGMLALKWFIFGVIQNVILGIVTAWLYKPAVPKAV